MPEYVPESFTVRVEGTRPLLMHNPAGVGKPSGRKTVFDPEEDAKEALYLNKKGEVIVPALNILSMLRTAGADLKVPGKGKKTFKGYIYAGVSIEPYEIPLIYSGEYEIDQRPVKVSGRVMRARPKFEPWALEFRLTILDEIIHPTHIKNILEMGGKYQGLCDFRPLFGLFQVVKFDKIDGGDDPTGGA